MTRNPLRNLITETQEAAPTKDILLAVSSALSGDHKRVRLLVAKAQKRIEKRLRQEIRGLGRSKPAPTKKKQKIRGAHLSTAERLPPMLPPGAVETRLPDGRKLMLVPARHKDMLAINRVSGANTKRAFTAINHNGRAIDQLAASQKALAERLAKLQSNGDLALLRGLVEGLANIERRMKGVKLDQDKALNAQKRSVQKQFTRQRRALAVQTRAMQIEKLHGAVASMQSAAFGTKGSLLATNNLLLVVNQLGWSLAPQVFEALGLAKPGVASSMAWLAPLASLLTSQATLGRRQHERFVSGVVNDFFVKTGSKVGVATLSLREHIAPAEWKAFAKRTDVPVTTVILEPRSSKSKILSSGVVSDGILSIRIEVSLPSIAILSSPSSTGVVVSWTVDTRRANG